MDDYTESIEDGPFLKSSQFKSLMASGLPAIVMRPVYQPLEILKIRFQLQQQNLTHNIHFDKIVKGEPYKSMFHALNVIYTEEGWRGFFRGLGFAQFANTSSTIIQFSIYRKLRKELHKTQLKDKKFWCDLLSGFVTGATTAVLMNPFDCIRTHLLARQGDPKNAFHTAKHVYESGGLNVFFNGAYTSLCHAGVFNALRFTFYNVACEYFQGDDSLKKHKDLRPIELFFAGFCAGTTANIFAYPIEFVKRRLMLQKAQKDNIKFDAKDLAKSENNCKAFFQCISTAIRTEGPMAVYKGFAPNAMKSIISTTIQLSCYDIIYHAIDDLFG